MAIVSKARSRTDRVGLGLGVDAGGGPVIDPTANVIALTEAANQRQDDLRKEFYKYVKIRFKYIEKLVNLRAEHTKEVASKESERLNSIRSVDILNASTSAAQALTAIQTLASSTLANAENIKATVAATATAMAAQQATMVSRIDERLAALERASYEGVGKQRVTGPQMAEFMVEVRNLVKDQATGAGSKAGGSAAWMWLILGIGAFSTLVGLAATAVVVVLYLTKAH